MRATPGIDLPGETTKPLSPAEQVLRDAVNAKVKAEAAERARIKEARRQEDHQAIRRLANRIWPNARQAEADHPYLVRKGISPDGFRQDERGNLLVPLYDDKGNLWNIERILPERLETAGRINSDWRARLVTIGSGAER